MPKCVFLSMDRLEGFVSDDLLAVEALKRNGWEVQTLSWRKPQLWDQFDVVVIRTTWDYQKSPELFLNTLAQIHQSKARLENPWELVQWNLSKNYLQELKQQGIPIIPTHWETSLVDPQMLYTCFQKFQTPELILKPVISANADDTFRLNETQIASQWPTLAKIFASRAFMIQPFLKNIVTEGEFSLLYFGGELSHTILKTPKTSDFRVQEEHGGQIQAVEPSLELKTIGQTVLSTLKETPLYARVDLVRLEKETYALMELELIEPSLYFRMDSRAPERFANALIQKMEHSRTVSFS